MSQSIRNALIAHLYANDRADGWCGHDVSYEALNNIVNRALEFQSNLELPQIQAHYLHDPEESQVTVSGPALQRLLQAVAGRPHEIREMVVLESLHNTNGSAPRGPINVLVSQFNAQVYPDKENV